MTQINTTGLPGTHIREFATLWDAGNRNNGIIFFTDSSSSPFFTSRAITTDGGVTWTAGVNTGLSSPAAPTADVRNPVIRDFAGTGNLTGLFGTHQGIYPSGFNANNVLFHATSTDLGSSWSSETSVTFQVGDFSGHTGLNGFVEVFETSGGILRGYTAMNNAVAGTRTRLVESTDGGVTWTDLGSININGPGGAFNVISANSPVFRFEDENGNSLMGWFVFGEGSGNRGVILLISADEGLTWTDEGIFSFLNANIRSGDALFLSDTELRLFYYINASGTPSDRQLWYQDFTLSGMSDIQPNNLIFWASANGPAPIPEPASILVWGTLALCGGAAGLQRRAKSSQSAA